MHNVRDEMVENQVRAHLRVVHTSAEDDLHLQEGAARFRPMQRHYDAESAMVGDLPMTAADYERHTSERPHIHAVFFMRNGTARCKTCTALDPPPGNSSRFWHIASAILAGILVAGLVLVIGALVTRAHAQTTPTNLLVRACPSTPSGPGFGACSNSVWAVPSGSLVVDVQRSGVSGGDIWIASSQINTTTDRVFACEDPTIMPGPFVNCPSLLPSQSNNYLAASLISWGTNPPVTAGTAAISWSPVTMDSTGAAIAQSVSYQVFIRLNNCSALGPSCQPLYPSTPAVDTTAAAANLSEPAGPYCVVLYAYFTGSPSTLSQASQETCGVVIAGKVTPMQVTGVKFNGGGQ